VKDENSNGQRFSSRVATEVSAQAGPQLTRALIAISRRQDFFGARWRGAITLLGLLLVLLAYMAVTTSVKLLPANRVLNSFQSGKSSGAGTRNQPH
jgi:hypothetical protein